MDGQVVEDPAQIGGIVGGDAQLRPRPHHAGEAGQIGRAHETALGVARLGPGIGKQQEDASQARIRQALDEEPGVVGPEPDIVELAPLDLAQKRGDAVAVDLAADERRLRRGLGLPGDMLAGAEADLEPKRGRRQRLAGIEQQARQQFVDEPALAGTQAPADTPAIEVAPPGGQVAGGRGSAGVAQWKAAVRSSTRSSRSQEKPPSASGLRPKWP
jgi:hypothetical protein